MNKRTRNWIAGILIIVIIQAIISIYYYLRDDMINWDNFQMGLVCLATYILYGLLFNKDYEEDRNKKTLSWTKGILIIVILSTIISLYDYLKDGIVNWNSIQLYCVCLFAYIVCGLLFSRNNED